MAKPDGEKEKAAGKEARKGPGAVARFCAGVALVVVLLYLVFGVAMSLAAVREAVCARMSERLGVKVTAESSRLSLPVAIVLRKVVTEGYEAGGAGFAIERLRISPGGAGRWHVSCERGSLRLAASRDGEWGPTGFASLGPVPESDLSGVSRFTADFCRDVTLDVAGLTVRWVRAEGELAAAGGVSFVVRPADLPGQPLLYHAFRAASVVGPGGARAADVRREWLAGEGMPYKELIREGGEGTGRGVFWEGTKQ